MRLREIMTKDVVSVTPEDSLAEAARRMRDAEVGCVVVTNGGRVAGIMTDRDLAVRCLCDDGAPKTCRVSKHMSTSVETAGPDTDVLEALNLMTQREIKRLPVIERGTLVGIVSFSDIAQALKEPMSNLLVGMGAARRTA